MNCPLSEINTPSRIYLMIFLSSQRLFIKPSNKILVSATTKFSNRSTICSNWNLILGITVNGQ